MTDLCMGCHLIVQRQPRKPARQSLSETRDAGRRHSILLGALRSHFLGYLWYVPFRARITIMTVPYMTERPGFRSLNTQDRPGSRPISALYWLPVMLPMVVLLMNAN